MKLKINTTKEKLSTKNSRLGTHQYVDQIPFDNHSSSTCPKNRINKQP